MINGVLNVYKEKGYTSHDVVACLRRIIGQKKIGHTGTLDPDAEGVLPVCLGRATKLCDMLTDKDKTYETVLLLGKSTDTQDISGRILEEKGIGNITDQMAEDAVRKFIGEYDQVPPMYSALKIGGRKLYELAREGKTVERKSRKVTIHDIRILSTDLPRIRMEVDCSKGTYIRTLCSDIGDMLGTGGCMEELLRRRVGRFRLEDSIKLSGIEQLSDEGRLSEVLVSPDEMFAEFPGIVMKREWVSLAYNGNSFRLDQAEIRNVEAESGDGEMEVKELFFMRDEKVRVYDPLGNFIGVYCFDGRKVFRPEKMFLDPDAVVMNWEGGR